LSQRDRILIVSTAQTVGGGEVYVERLANALHDRFRISVLAGSELLKRLDASVSRVRLSRFPRRLEQNVRGGYTLKELYYYLRHGSGSLFRRTQTDLVHFQIYDRCLISLLTKRLSRDGIPALITIHTEFRPESVAAKRPHPREVLNALAGIICVCRAAKKNLVRLGIPADKCHVIYNGVDVRRFTPAAGPGKIVTWIGRVDERDKNPMLFVRIAELAHERKLAIRFRIAGDGPLLPFIKRHAETKGMRNLELSGWCADILQVYREASIVCLTSTSEALPLTISEAMAAGVPVVAPNVGGIPELIKDESVGTLVSSATPEAFLDAIVSLLENPARYESVRRAARAWVEEAFSVDGMVAATSKLYEELLSG